MTLNDQQLRDLYFGLVKPFQHPDPVGFMTRALLLSEGDPDFIEDGVAGFLPLNPQSATQETGVPEIFTLENNVVAALSLDRINYDALGSVDQMVIATHFPEDDTEETTKEQREFLEAISENRKDVHDILEPPLATVKDVIRILSDNKQDTSLSKQEYAFFEFLLDGK